MKRSGQEAHPISSRFAWKTARHGARRLRSRAITLADSASTRADPGPRKQEGTRGLHKRRTDVPPTPDATSMLDLEALGPKSPPELTKICAEDCAARGAKVARSHPRGYASTRSESPACANARTEIRAARADTPASERTHNLRRREPTHGQLGQTRRLAGCTGAGEFTDSAAIACSRFGIRDTGAGRVRTPLGRARGPHQRTPGPLG
ncbi:hypothetical protein GCM10020358_74170 [Amorphoplanes nipponensis]|uniref:Uncharacterized protein n=1 Tax=Actinoplanes nipponensis TaxID=135950 RepID=A0A919JF21_9ACTN|nr:hypothetical protein Ani05nite_16790 [Actinoplanes nipponensis]